jgi:fructokinase
MRIGAIKAGGTKVICGVGNETGQIEERICYPTEMPERTIGQVIDYFRDKNVDAIGIGTFGPIDVDPASSTYGYVTTTPKPGWSEYPFMPMLRKVFNVLSVGIRM